MADGTPDRRVAAPSHGLSPNQQITALGNGVVPLQALTALASLTGGESQRR